MLDTSTLPTAKGTYILLMQLSTAQSLMIGRLGMFDLAAGWYAYVGSAFGSGGLAGRLKHHFKPAPRPHWHIDYLRQVAPLVEVCCAASDTRLECTWAAALKHMPGAEIPIPRFGASDCRCEAHLFRFVMENRPTLGELAAQTVGGVML